MAWKHLPLYTYFRGTVRVTCRTCNQSSAKLKDTFDMLAVERARHWWIDHTKLKEKPLKEDRR